MMKKEGKKTRKNKEKIQFISYLEIREEENIP